MSSEVRRKEIECDVAHISAAMFLWVLLEKSEKCAFDHPFADKTNRRGGFSAQKCDNVGMAQTPPNDGLAAKGLGVELSNLIRSRHQKDALFSQLLYRLHVVGWP
jgi:hypothetical protein